MLYSSIEMLNFKMKKRSLFWYVTPPLLLVLILGVIMPWCIGVVLHKNVLKRFQALDNHPNYHFVLKKFELGIYQSRAHIEISSKSSYKDKPQIHLVVEENIQQGPIIFDWATQKCFFNLAKINSLIVPQETPFIKFDQNELRLTSLVNYRWRQDIVTHCEKVSGQIFVADNKPYIFSLQEMSIKGNLAISALHLLQEFKIKDLRIFDAKKNSMILKNLHLHLGGNLAALSSFDRAYDLITCDTVELNVNKHKMTFENSSLKSTLTAESSKSLLALEAQIHFDELRVRDKKYGPLAIDLAMHHIPKTLMQDELIQKLKNLLRNKKNSNELYAFLQKEMKIETLDCDLKTFTLEMPGGILSLQGNVALSPIINEDLPYLCSGKLTASLPKQALQQLLSPIHADMLVTNGLLLEVNDTLKGFLLLKDNNLYLNGADPFDALSRFETTAFKQSSHPEQNLVLALLADDNATLQTLVKEGVHLQETVNHEGKSPLHLAAFMGNSEAVRLFLNSNISVNATDHQGSTALFWAAKEGHVEVIKLLLNKGADPLLKNARDITPLDIAEEYRRNAAIAVLKEYPKTGD